MTDKKNILIVTPFYKQDKNIASVRWTKLTERLSKKHNIIIVTQPLIGSAETFSLETEENGVIVARIDQTTGYQRIARKYFGAAKDDDWQTKTGGSFSTENIENDSFIRKLKNSILYKSEASTAKKLAHTILNKVIPNVMKIDVVISSACPFLEMEIGYELKRLLGCKWISDFRDLPYTEDTSDITHHMKKIMVNELSSADAIITIASRGRHFFRDNGIIPSSDKVHVITNGFSRSDAVVSAYSDISCDKLMIVHTGAPYFGLRRTDMLFKAIKCAKAKMPDFSCIVNFAGGNNKSFIDPAIKLGLEDCAIDCGFIPRNEALSLQQNSDCLLILSFEKVGSLSAKIFEYMLAEKPVINISCGNHESCEEYYMVSNLNLGIAVSEDNEDDDVQRLADYLIMQYNRKLSGECLLYEPDREAIKKYDHDNIALQIENLINDMLA